MICIIRMAKKRGERRCFKVPEFDSSESVSDECACVCGHICSAEDKNRKRCRETEPEKERLIWWKVADGKREQGGTADSN